MTKTEAFEEHLHLLLCEKKFDAVLEAIKDPDNESYISEDVWSIINLICLTVKTNSLLKSDVDVTSCKKILLSLVNQGNPKEVLVSLLEQADSFKDHEFFCLLLDPLQLILKKTPGKRGKSLQWVLSTLNAHIETLNPPKDLDLQGEEKLLLDADPSVLDATYVLSNYLNFIEYFVNEVSFESLKKKEIYYIDRIRNQQEIMHKYILKLFYKPLLYHDLCHVSSDNKPKSTIRTICEGYIRCLSKICHNVFNLFKYDSLIVHKNKQSVEDDDDDINLLAFSNLSYLIFVENLALDFQPFIYSHLFIFMTHLKYIISLLKMKENLILFKGLHLTEALLNKLDDLQLNYDYMELEIFTEFPKLLLNTSIYCQIEAHRKLSIRLFLTYVSKCNYKGRYHLIMQVLSTIKHSGAEGLVINLYKTNLHEALSGSVIGEYFLGKNLNLFLKKVYVLNEGVETDILENSDKIVTSLNFLRYLLLRDKKERNTTGIWDLVESISEDYLNPLSMGLDLSRAHYKQAIKDADDQSKLKESVNTTVSVNNEILPNVPLHFQKDVFQKALITFDVIESILSRVKELIPD